MEKYEVKWSYESIYDAADIAEYIERSFGIERADLFSHDIDCEIEKLSYSYQAYSSTEMRYRGLIIQKMVYDPSVVFFCVSQKEKTIYILRILRHERNWDRLLRRQIVCRSIIGLTVNPLNPPIIAPHL